MICPGCGRNISKNNSFCPRCGESLENKCSKCDKNNQSDASFCPECGERLRSTKNGSENINLISDIINTIKATPKLFQMFNLITIIATAIILIVLLVTIVTPLPFFSKTFIVQYIIPILGFFLFYIYASKSKKSIIFLITSYMILITAIVLLTGFDMYYVTQTLSYDFSLRNLPDSPPSLLNLYTVIYLYFLKMNIPIIISGIIGVLLGKIYLMHKDNILKYKFNFLKKWNKTDLIALSALGISLITASTGLWYGWAPGDLTIDNPTAFGVVNDTEFPNNLIVLQLELQNDGGQDLVIKNLYLLLNETNSNTKTEPLNFTLVGEYPEISSESFNKNLTYEQSLIIKPHSTVRKVLVFSIKDWNNSKPIYNSMEGKTYNIDFGYTNYQVNRKRNNITKTLEIRNINTVNHLQSNNKTIYWWSIPKNQT